MLFLELAAPLHCSFLSWLLFKLAHPWNVTTTSHLLIAHSFQCSSRYSLSLVELCSLPQHKPGCNEIFKGITSKKLDCVCNFLESLILELYTGLCNPCYSSIRLFQIGQYRYIVGLLTIFTIYYRKINTTVLLLLYHLV